MRKLLIAAAAATLIFAPVAVLTSGAASAGPCVGAGRGTLDCERCVSAHSNDYQTVCNSGPAPAATTTTTTVQAAPPPSQTAKATPYQSDCDSDYGTPQQKAARQPLCDQQNAAFQQALANAGLTLNLTPKALGIEGRGVCEYKNPKMEARRPPN